jgi:hypothetical protein
MEPMAAIARAKEYLSGALRESFPIGAGHSPVNHFYAVPQFDPRATAVRSGGTHGS